MVLALQKEKTDSQLKVFMKVVGLVPFVFNGHNTKQVCHARVPSFKTQLYKRTYFFVNSIMSFPIRIVPLKSNKGNFFNSNSNSNIIDNY